MIEVITNPNTDNYNGLKSFVLSNEIRWHWADVTDPQSTLIATESQFENFGYMCHAFLQRPHSTCLYSKETSELSIKAHNYVLELLRYNDIRPYMIYRICVNSVFPTETGKYSTPHVDHPFPHKNLIVYLTNPQGGDTVVEGESYLGKEDDAIIFEGQHYHKPPKRDRRVVLVATFSSESAPTITNSKISLRY